jgi:two-component system nitrate/nitrite response regulator NarL
VFHVVLWDLGTRRSSWLPARGGALADADAEEDGPPALALVASEEAAEEALAAGALGVLFREVDALRLKAALVAVALGLAVLDEALAPRLLRQRSAAPAAPAEHLTPRELEVLQLLAEGLSNKQIAGRLAISEHTAKFHVNSIVGKLGAQSRTDAAVRAARLGLILL